MAARGESRQMTLMLDQAVQTFADAMKAGVRMQEEAARWWSDLLEQAPPVQAWQSRSQAVLGEMLPLAARNAEDWLKTLEQNSLRSLELMRKAMESGAEGGGGDLAARTRELWQASLEVARNNAQAMARTSAEMMQMWSELMQRNVSEAGPGGRGAEKGGKVAEKAGRGA